MSLYILIPSGVNDNIDFAVINEGKDFQISVTWPLFMYDVENLWPKKSIETKMEMQTSVADFQLKKAAARKMNVVMRREKDDRMRSIAKIRLPRVSSCQLVPTMMKRGDGGVSLSVDLWCEEKESHTTVKGAGLLSNK